MKKTVVELFAGVGGFRVGLNNITSIDENGHAIENGPFNFVWANQWEPSTKIQHAFDCYNLRFPNENNSNVDISLVKKIEIPNHSVLCGGFPCQDYSVARSLSKEKGIEGKKGVLWWQINDILTAKKPPFVLLENVDRLIKSPSKQRGRDFGIMLRCLNDQGYAVEWRIINAAEYGHPQRRRRIYIFAFHKSTEYYKKCIQIDASSILRTEGIFAKTFKIKDFKNFSHANLIEGYADLVSLSDKFKTAFETAGYMINGEVYNIKYEPVIEPFIPLRDIVIKNGVDTHYFLTDNEIKKYEFLRGSKKVPRKRPDGSEYFYSEGSMSPIDSLELPGRTMLTSEGNTNRSTHIIIDPHLNKIRLLHPIECERLNQFPDDWTNSGMPENRRYFMMGNALVCGIIQKLGKEINKIIENEK